MRIPLASSGLRPQDIQAAIDTLNSGNLTMGERVKTFEKKVSEYIGMKHFVMTNSGSSANLAIFEALLRPSKGTPALRKGDGVLVPAIAWPTTIWPIIQLGLEPIFVDVDENTIGIDLILARKAIAQSKVPVRAIFPIHPLGLTLDQTDLLHFANEFSLILVNDVCESLGSWRDGHHAGAVGVASSFSFYFSHHITTMEGGGVGTNDDAFADDLRAIRSHGWSRDRSDVLDWTNGVSLTDSKFLFVTTGYNIRPMEIQAAIGINQITDIDDFVTKRRNIASRVYSALKGTRLEVIAGQAIALDSKSHSWMLIPIRVKGIDAKKQKQKILEKLELLGIETRPVLTGNFLAQPSMNRIDGDHPPATNFKVATEITENCFLVGAHHDLNDEQINFLSSSLRTCADMMGDPE
jgi:CDP-6-deoxy-D-xylo-4-hexulose-3-dehydrase